MLFRRGDITLVDFDPAQQFEAAAKRPAIIVSNNLSNSVMHVVVVLPLTTNLARVYPHETVLPIHRSGLEESCKTQPHLIRHINTGRIKRTLSHVPEDLMVEIDAKLREHLAL